MTDLAKEYGTALFMLAAEEGAGDAYAEALHGVLSHWRDEPSYVLMLSSPSIPLAERLSLIAEAFAERVPAHVLSYLQLMCEKGRIEHFADSVAAYDELLAASQHVLDVAVTSAVPLTDAQKQSLESKLQTKYGATVHAVYEVDEAVLGGLVVAVDGKVLDGSLRRRLRKIKEVMSR